MCMWSMHAWDMELKPAAQRPLTHDAAVMLLVVPAAALARPEEFPAITSSIMRLCWKAVVHIA